MSLEEHFYPGVARCPARICTHKLRDSRGNLSRIPAAGYRVGEAADYREYVVEYVRHRWHTDAAIFNPDIVP